MEPRAETLILKQQGKAAKFPQPEVLGLDKSQGTQMKTGLWRPACLLISVKAKCPLTQTGALNTQLRPMPLRADHFRSLLLPSQVGLSSLPERD